MRALIVTSKGGKRTNTRVGKTQETNDKGGGERGEKSRKLATEAGRQILRGGRKPSKGIRREEDLWGGEQSSKSVICHRESWKGGKKGDTWRREEERRGYSAKKGERPCQVIKKTHVVY